MPPLPLPDATTGQDTCICFFFEVFIERNRNTDPGWVSYLVEGAFYSSSNISVTAPGFLRQRGCRRNRVSKTVIFVLDSVVFVVIFVYVSACLSYRPVPYLRCLFCSVAVYLISFPSRWYTSCLHTRHRSDEAAGARYGIIDEVRESGRI